MSPALITLILFSSLLVLLLSGFPVAFVLLGLATAGYLVFGGPQVLYTLVSTANTMVMTDTFIAIPLFIFMAVVLERSGFAGDLYQAMFKWFGGLRGGLAIGSVAIATLIAATTGLAGTDVAIMGMMAYPQMIKRGYDKGIAIGCIPAGGALGPLIPPSLIMIIIGYMAHVSVGKLFIGGIIPGLLMSALFMLYIGVRCRFQPQLAPALPPEERATWAEKLRSLRGVVFALVLVATVLGGIYGGVFTPTEAGGIGAAGSLALAAFYRKLNWRGLKEMVAVAFGMISLIGWILVGGGAFSSLSNYVGVNNFISNALTSLPEASPMVIVVFMMAIVFLLGMVLESLAIVFITLPVFMPVVVNLGFDPLWFALLYTINIIIGLVSPPFGWALFYFKALGHPGVAMQDIYRAIWPFVGIMVLVLALGIAFPQILVWLPNRMIR